MTEFQGGGNSSRCGTNNGRAPHANRADLQSVINAIRAAVSRRNGLPVSDVLLVAAGVIPRTTSGKLARRACRAQYLNGELGVRGQP